MPFTVINLLDRQRARNQSERVATESRDENVDVPDLEQGSANTAQDEDENSLVSVEEGHAEDDPENSAGEANHERNSTENSPTIARPRTRLNDLEEERDLFRRRSSICIMFAVFFLFRLWIEALNSGDFGLLVLCIAGTSWTARWVRHSREREEELDRLIAEYNEGQGEQQNANVNMSQLSFQAQLALAIMESQRQMTQGGGYGHSSQGNNPGVSEDAKEKWYRFEYNEKLASSTSAAVANSSVAYGSVKTVEEEEPNCSICLGEYESGEACVKLPCNHVYHDECITSWTTNHVKCPLCNFDLAGNSDEENTAHANEATASA